MTTKTSEKANSFGSDRLIYVDSSSVSPLVKVVDPIYIPENIAMLFGGSKEEKPPGMFSNPDTIFMKYHFKRANEESKKN